MCMCVCMCADRQGSVCVCVCFERQAYRAFETARERHCMSAVRRGLLCGWSCWWCPAGEESCAGSAMHVEAGLQGNCCAADSLLWTLCGSSTAAAVVLMTSCCLLQAAAQQVLLHAGKVCQCCHRTFAELALHQCCCCCQSLCGVLKLAESLQLDHLWAGSRTSKQQAVSSRAAAAAGGEAPMPLACS